MNILIKDYKMKVVSIMVILLIGWSSIATMNFNSQTQAFYTDIQRITEENEDSQDDLEGIIQNNLNQGFFSRLVRLNYFLKFF